MAVKKQLTQEQKLDQQRKFNAELVKSGAYMWQDGRMVPNGKMGYDEANRIVDDACKTVTEKTCSKRR
jgi:polyhydroxyalkanoate synthesis regulator phasin